MSFKVSGDFAKKLDRWAELLESSKVIVKHASQAQAEVALTLIGEGFASEQDPYGKRWAPKKKPDGRKVLHGDTTRLRNGWHVAKSGMGGWQVDPGVEYAAYHQEPRGNSRPQRRMVPDSARGLPREWAEEFEAVAVAVAIDHFAEAAASSKPKTKKRTKSPPVSAIVQTSSSSSSGTRRRTRRRSSGSAFATLRRLRSLAKRAGVL